MRTFVIGDIHGQYKALMGCLNAVGFDQTDDRLIALGDVCDRGGRVRECIEELRKLKHCVYLVGNHDVMSLAWSNTGIADEHWMSQGGNLTYLSYGGRPLPRAHARFLAGGRWYFEDSGRLFVHGGFDPTQPLVEQPTERLVWDRDLVVAGWRAFQAGIKWSVPGFEEVFVGHTPTGMFGSNKPVQFGNLWLLDTGAGHGRLLTIMNVETKEFWQERAAE